MSIGQQKLDSRTYIIQSTAQGHHQTTNMASYSPDYALDDSSFETISKNNIISKLLLASLKYSLQIRGVLQTDDIKLFDLIQGQISNAQNAVPGLLQLAPPNERRSSRASELANKVFRITELFEHII